MQKENKIGWFYKGYRVIENDGFFVRVSNGDVYAWTIDGKLI